MAAARAARIPVIVTATPPTKATIDDLWDALAHTGRRRMPRLSTQEGARTRHLAQSVASLTQPRTQSEQTDAYLEHARVLAREVCCEALDRGGIARSAIGLIVGVSCTGMVLPSLDAELIPILGLPPGVDRLPITELGCGAGIAGMARALDYTRAYPDRAALLFAVELPSLTFQPADHSVDNLVASMVFGDGAGAMVLQAGEAQGGWVVEQCGTTLIPEGAGHLGYELRDGGLRVVLSRRLPEVVEARLRAAVESFLAAAGTSMAQVDVVAAHPGGPRIFDAIESALGLSARALDTSRQVFEAYGNASSAGIFFVFDALSKNGAAGRVLAVAFGPGLSIEMALMRLSRE
jgi:alkylresorcinol/alkylpyrone synthase